MTKNELAYNIRNKLEGGRSTNNSFISLDQIKYGIDYYRSLFIHRDFRRSLNREQFEQELSSIEFEHIERESFTSPTFFFKSVKKIPNFIRIDNSYLISLYNKRFDQVIPIEVFHRSKLKKYNKFTSKTPTASFRNGYIYISADVLSQIIDKSMQGEEIDLSLLENLEDFFVVTGVFENPSEAYIFNGEDPEDVDDLPYPISADYAQRITEAYVQAEGQLLTQIPPDVTKDNLPNRAQQ